jgi:hypothetical protein
MIRKLPVTDDLLNIAERTVWFKKPTEALADPVHLIAHVLTYGTHETVSMLRNYVSDQELKEALMQAPAGIFDPRSWSYWHLLLGQYPPPPLPSRNWGNA